MPRPIVPAPSTAIWEIPLSFVSDMRSSGDGNRAQAGGALGEGRELVGDGERVARRLGGEPLRFGGGAEPLEHGAAEAVVLDLLGLDDVAIEARRLVVAGALAEGDELGVAHLGDRLAGERPGGDAL